MSAAGVRGLRATYHRLLDKVELMLPEKLRPLYNHPAGNGPRMAAAEPCPASASEIDLQRPADHSAARGLQPPQPQPAPARDSVSFPPSPLSAGPQPPSLASLGDPWCAPSLRLPQTRTGPLGSILPRLRGHQGAWPTRKRAFSPPGLPGGWAVAPREPRRRPHAPEGLEGRSLCLPLPRAGWPAFLVPRAPRVEVPPS